MRNEGLNSDSFYKEEQTIPLNYKNIKKKHCIFKSWEKSVIRKPDLRKVF